MSRKRKIHGEAITDRHIDEWVAEAEAGYDSAVLRKRGRPVRGSEPSQVIALRLSPEELALLDRRAEREGMTRSEVIRIALARMDS